MEHKIQELFESGNYKLAYELMHGQCIDRIDIDINKLLKSTDYRLPDVLGFDNYESKIFSNRTHDFTLQIVSNVPDGNFWNVYICDFRGNLLDKDTVREYGNLLIKNPTYYGNYETEPGCWLIAVSKEDVLNLIFTEPIFDD